MCVSDLHECVCMCVYTCVCTMYVPGAHKSQERVLDVLELELWMVVNCHEDGGN